MGSHWNILNAFNLVLYLLHCPAVVFLKYYEQLTIFSILLCENYHT